MEIKVLKLFASVAFGLGLIVFFKLAAERPIEALPVPVIESVCIENDEMEFQELYVELQRMQAIEDVIVEKIKFRERRKNR